MSRVMPSTSSDDLSIINDSQFLEELDRCNASDVRSDRPGDRPRTRYADAFDALDSGLAVSPDAPEFSEPPRDDAVGTEWHEPPVARLAPKQNRVPAMAAAFIVLVGLTAGGATAALVFHDQVVEITASWASR
jgi:hypothetical protein